MCDIEGHRRIPTLRVSTYLGDISKFSQLDEVTGNRAYSH